MKRKRKFTILFLTIFTTILTAQSAGNETDDSISAIVLAPKTLYTGTTGTVSITTINTNNHSPAVTPVTVLLSKKPQVRLCVFNDKTDSRGKALAQFYIPRITPGIYTLEVKVEGVTNVMAAPVQVCEMPILLIETDKPIYKPSQKIQGRILVLANQLKPISSKEAQVEITDAKGVKIFKKQLITNAFGVAPFNLDLANELNFGTWKITAESGSASGTIDVRVEKYVLPRFEVELLTGRDYFLVDEKITGTIKANYFFGKPVDGTVEVRASRYIGVWEQYASYTATLSEGQAEFSLPSVEYVSGTHGAGGAGSAQLDVVVTDTSGHEEKTTKLLKIVESTIQHQLIALSNTITPGRPFDVLLVAETPDSKPVNVTADLTCEYYDENYTMLFREIHELPNVNGSATISLTAAKDTAWAQLHSSVRDNKGNNAETDLIILASSSPSDSFLQLRRISSSSIHVGDTVNIEVFQTHNVTVYYDVYANGYTVWSGFTTSPEIVFQATQQMVPAAKVVAYIINPNNEISADTFQFEVAIDNLAELNVEFNAEEVLPGEPVEVSVQTDTQAMVGVSIVDESVYALAAGRLNMQEVFNELERRFMEPQLEIHEFPSCHGAYEVFDEAGLQVITSESIQVPQGQKIEWWWFDGWEGVNIPAIGGGGGKRTDEDIPLAEVTRIRQFFPETWLWMPDLLTAQDGSATIDLTAPDSITTWRLHAVSTSDNGLGICESSLRVFQEFFGEPDLPYAVTRGEQFPVRVQIFNYLDEPQLVQVELTEAEWFDLLEPAVQQINVNANSVGLASFLIQPTKLGHNILEVTLRSALRADAVRKELLVEAEGTQREIVTNGIIRAGQTLALDANIPLCSVPGSEKLLLSVTPSLVAQSISGVEDLLHMPYGCGEQNMIFFAPDVEILRYLNATGQLTPEIRAKAEHFITVGYQRQLTYRRQDGSFSAFGDTDKSGSLWLTAFVLDCFSGAKDVQTIDENILSEAAQWIEQYQLSDGSWEPIGFIHHKEMIGGMSGRFALTAFVSIALADYGYAESGVLEAASEYLIDNISDYQDDAYALSIAALAFARLNKLESAEETIERLLEIAISDDSGIHWEPHPIEATAYVALAMIELEDHHANSAIKWLSLQQNSKGGFSSTQDTVMALKALMTAAQAQSRNVNLTVTVKSADKTPLAELMVNSTNFDVLQIVELPTVNGIELSATGTGETRYQLVRRFNVLLRDQIIEKDMALEVTYDADHVDVDDIVNVTAIVRYFGRPGTSGMMIVDVGVPTGFTPVMESLDALVEEEVISKFEIAGRKVIFYVDGLESGEERLFTFQVKARFPVRAIIPDSKSYLYYQPEVRAEAAGKEITVGFLGCTVDFKKLADFSSQWLGNDSALEADLDNSGLVDFKDFATLTENWRDACPDK